MMEYAWTRKTPQTVKPDKGGKGSGKGCGVGMEEMHNVQVAHGGGKVVFPDGTHQGLPRVIPARVFPKAPKPSMSPLLAQVEASSAPKPSMAPCCGPGAYVEAAQEVKRRRLTVAKAVKEEVVDEDADLLEAATQAGDQEAIRNLTEAKQALRDSQARELEADQENRELDRQARELEAPEMKTEIADEAELLLAAEQVDLAYSPCSKWRADAVEGDIEDAEESDYLM